jgi:hypothetical protein
MRKFLPLLVLFSLAFFDCFSQADFRTGYVITNDLDTIHGLIDYRSESRSANFCVFRKSFSTPAITYYPGDIFGYRYAGDKYYVSREVNLEGINKIYFLEYLFNGIVSIYFFMEGNREYFLLESAAGELHFLTNEEVDRYFEDKGRYKISSNKYIGQLRYIFSDYPELQRKIDRSKLSHTSLITIANEYHQYICPDEECIIYSRNLPAVSLQLALFSGLNVTGMSFSGYPFFANLGSINSNSPSVGGLLKISLPRVHEKFTIPISFEYGRSYYHKYTENSFSSNYLGNEYHDVHISSNHLKLCTGLSYTYPTGKVRPSLSAGFLFVREFSGEIRRVSDFERGSIIYSQPDEIFPMPIASYGIRLSAGLDFHPWIIFKPFLNLNYDYLTSEMAGWRYPNIIRYQFFSHNVFIQFGIYI